MGVPSGEGAVLFEEGSSRQEHMRESRCFVEEQILHHHTFHRGQSLIHMMRVRVGLGDVFTLHIDPLKGTIHRSGKHVRNTQARFLVEARTPLGLEQITHAII